MLLENFDKSLSTRSKQPFRLISYASYDAAMNMAIDEAILEAHLAGHVPPTLRVYQFSPPAVSFGYAQKVSSDLIDKIKKHNFAVVRRPTGGRAVLHMGDITYAFICSSKGSPLADYALLGESIALSYKKICEALILALQSLGVQTMLGYKNNRYQDKHDCFLATTVADLQYDGKKIAGSAQLRRRHAVLQHGSIILNQPQSLLPQLLSTKQETVSIVDDNCAHHVDLFQILGCRPDPQELQAALKYGFELVFARQFLEAELTSLEKILVAQSVSRYQIFNELETFAPVDNMIESSLST